MSLRPTETMNTIPRILWASLLVLGTGMSGLAQEKASLDTVVSRLENRMAQATEQLAEVRKQIQTERAPLAEQRNALENDLIKVRKEYDEVLSVRSARELDVSNMERQIGDKKKQNQFLMDLIDEYTRALENSLHISESQRYGNRLSELRLTAENPNHSLENQFLARFSIVDLSTNRIDDNIGGAIFQGTAKNPDGLIGEGKFLLLGPTVYFAGENDSFVGLVDAQPGSNEPAITAIPEGIDISGVSQVANTGAGSLPLDITLGTAIRVIETQGTIWEEIKIGGAVMVPLLGLAGASLLIALIKWFQMSRIKRIPYKRFDFMMRHLNEGRDAEARAIAEKTKGPIGEMLEEGVAHAHQPRGLIEEVLYEQVLRAKANLNSLLPFIKITAAAAPLLGLLGTVSGMINTFRLITLFGTGDASKFASGISEALITTKWGLIVAIPSLLLAAYLTRKAKGIVDDMEKLGIRFMNHLSPDMEKKPSPDNDSADDGEPEPQTPPFKPIPPKGDDPLPGGAPANA
ncbi:MAG: MotA/TolQ/ExbB proton channel family protein [Verrucomicrobiota bacterium]